MFPSLEELHNDFNSLYNHLKQMQSPVVFCHNDLLLGNVIYTEEEQKVTFIDYEYAACNFQGFDIGNHFTEYGGESLKTLSKVAFSELFDSFSFQALMRSITPVIPIKNTKGIGFEHI